MATDINLRALWKRVQNDLQRQYGEDVYGAFLSKTHLHSLNSGRAVVHVGTVFLGKYIRSNYQDAIKQSLRRHGNEVHQLVIELPSSASQSRPPVQSDEASEDEIVALGKKFNLFSLFRFENFVKGQANALAYEGSLKIAQQLQLSNERYNPLYIYGDVGNGKSHLLHAIGWGLLENGCRRIACVNAQNFLSNFVDVVRNSDRDRMMAFKDYFCSLDALLFDDFQFLLGKEKTVDQWKQIFNELIGMGKKIVVTGNDHPSSLTGFPEYVTSRLGSGLVAEIKKSDYQLRFDILRQSLLTHHSSLRVSDDILQMLASRVNVNNRALLSILGNLEATNQLEKKSITSEVALEVIAEWWQKEHVDVKADDIIKQTAQYYGISIDDLLSSSRLRSLVRPRQMAMFLMKKMTSLSYPAISHKFRKKNHTTVLHAIKVIQQRREDDMSIRNDMERLMEILRHEADH